MPDLLTPLAGRVMLAAGRSLYDSDVGVTLARGLLQVDEVTHELSPGVKAGLSIGVVALVTVAGMMAGLTLGLLSLDRLDLEVLLRSGTTKEQVQARRLLPLVTNPHWVLCTLVIVNAASQMALPLCLDRLVNVVVALVLSTTAIVIFGEIVPQAVCSRYGMSIGGRAAPAIRVLMWITCPLSWPMGKTLDYFLGSENSLFARGQLRALVDLHRESSGLGGPLNEDEFNVILGALDLTSKVALKAMTPLDKVVMLSTDDYLDKTTLQRILDSGHSRIPVYQGSDRNAIMGLLITKELIRWVGPMHATDTPVKVGSLPTRDLPHLPVTTPMFDLLNLFQTGHSHMALLVAAASDGSAAETGSQAGGGSAAAHDPAHQLQRKRSLADKVRHGLQRMHLMGGAVSEEEEELEGHRHHKGARQPTKHSQQPNPQQPQQQANNTALQIQGSDGSSSTAPAHVALSIANGHNSPTPAASELDAAVDLGRQRSVERRAASANDLTRLSANSVPTTTAVMVADAVAAALATNSEPAAAGGGGGGDAESISSVGAGGGGGGRRKRRKEVVTRSTPLLPHPSMVPVGIITLEDVMEELMQEEIVDETDRFVDNEKTTRVNARLLTMSLPPKLRRVLMAGQLAHTAAAATAIALSKQELSQKDGEAGLHAAVAATAMARSGSGNLEQVGSPHHGGQVGPRTSWPLAHATSTTSGS